MKKPVMPKGAELDAIIDKRVNQFITITKAPPVGNLEKVIAEATAFAKANGVDVSEVKFGSDYYVHVMKIRRRETDAEKRTRVTNEERYKYRSKKWEWDRWKSEEDARIRREEAALTNKVKDVQKAIDNRTIVVKCDHKCACK